MINHYDGLRSSVARFHEHLSEKLRNMCFRPSKADLDQWFCKHANHSEYLARFDDDGFAFSKDPMAILKERKKFDDYFKIAVSRPPGNFSEL